MKEKSFGIIPVVRDKNKNSYQVLLVRSKKYGHWGFPKGRGENNEDPVTAARREFEEETGIKDYFVIRDVELEEKWSFERDGREINKTVRYFLGMVRSPEVKPQAKEVAEYRWTSLSQAGELLSFQNKKDVLHQVEHYLAGVSISKKVDSNNIYEKEN